MRLSEYLVKNKLVETDTKSFALVLSGCVYVNGEKMSSLQRNIYMTDLVVIKKNRQFVSRGGEKLSGALNHFDINVRDSFCLDAGASTGGFTDCLLQRGAGRVYAVDVAYGKLDWTLRTNTRVVNLEQHNIRTVREYVPTGHIDLAVVDISFSSLKGIIPVMYSCIKKGGRIIALVKPQFELHPRKLRKGIVSDPADQKEAVENIISSINKKQLIYKGEYPSPLKGTKGNQEYFILWEVV